MPAHAVFTVAVEIQQATIEWTTACRADLIQERYEPAGPAFSAVLGAAVAIGHVVFCQEHRQARYRVVAAIDLNDRLLPLDPVHQQGFPMVGVHRQQPMAAERPRQRRRRRLVL